MDPRAVVVHRRNHYPLASPPTPSLLLSRLHLPRRLRPSPCRRRHRRPSTSRHLAQPATIPLRWPAGISLDLQTPCSAPRLMDRLALRRHLLPTGRASPRCHEEAAAGSRATRSHWPFCCHAHQGELHENRCLKITTEANVNVMD